VRIPKIAGDLSVCAGEEVVEGKNNEGLLKLHMR
jgi:hypothetical protein